MNKLGQFGIILLILLVGDIVQKYFQLSIPSTVIGMIILLLLLLLRIVKIQWVDGISKILLDNLSLLFIPAGVGIINEFQIFKGHLLPIIAIIVITTIIVILVTGYTVQVLIGPKDK